jgi:hypothetical protein
LDLVVGLVVSFFGIYQATAGPCKEALKWVDFIHRAQPLSFFYCISRRNKLTLFFFVPIFFVFCRRLFKVSYAKENPGDTFESFVWIK